MIDFDNFKINCSQIGSLMGVAKGNRKLTEAEIKKLFNTLGRDYGELSESMKNTAYEILTKEIYYEPNKPSGKILSELILIYTYEMYGKTKISRGNDSPHAAEKGNMAEPAAIEFLSRMDGIVYEKNDELFENKWIKGVPDIIVRGKGKNVEKIIEVKTSYDLPSFIMAMHRNETSDNLFEVMGYMDLLNCKNAEIVHCLVDMPGKIVSFEEKRLRDRYNWLEIDDDVIEDRIGRAIINMEYSGIPDELKIFRRSVPFNKLSMKAAKSRATVAKKWMKGIHHVFTKNLVNLPETEE
jgi:hypothetical protein